MTQRGSHRFFDDREVDSLRTAGPRAVKEEDIVAFARLSGDDHPVHLDEAYGRDSGFGGRIAHGRSGCRWRWTSEQGSSARPCPSRAA